MSAVSRLVFNPEADHATEDAGALFRPEQGLRWRAVQTPAPVTFEDDRCACDRKDAQGFIKLNALRLRTLEMRNRKGN